jgi:hypothetical protein
MGTETGGMVLIIREGPAAERRPVSTRIETAPGTIMLATAEADKVAVSRAIETGAGGAETLIAGAVRLRVAVSAAMVSPPAVYSMTSLGRAEAVAYSLDRKMRTSVLV